MLNGLQEYIDKHGRHFTKELAEDALCIKDADKVLKRIERIVWYNVSNSTIGDILYIYTNAYIGLSYSKRRNIKYALSIVEDINMDGVAFSSWIGNLITKGEDFDFNQYI